MAEAIIISYDFVNDVLTLPDVNSQFTLHLENPDDIRKPMLLRVQTPDGFPVKKSLTLNSIGAKGGRLDKG